MELNNRKNLTFCSIIERCYSVNVSKMLYTEEEKLEILKLIYKHDGLVYRARQEYQTLHPDRQVPSINTFKNIQRHMSQYKSLKRKKRVSERDNEEQELNTMLHFEGNTILLVICLNCFLIIFDKVIHT